MTFEFTHHAIDRYIKRIEPGLSYNEGKLKLEQLAHQVTPIKTKTAKGQHQWLCNNPPCAFVTKHVHRAYLVVTILGPDEMSELGFDDERDEDPWED